MKATGLARRLALEGICSRFDIDQLRQTPILWYAINRSLYFIAYPAELGRSDRNAAELQPIRSSARQRRRSADRRAHQGLQGRRKILDREIGAKLRQILRFLELRSSKHGK